MTPQDIIREVEENAGEWLEMTQNPSAFVAGVLAHKVVSMNFYIEYLEKRLQDESRERYAASRL